jgi:hypothetical protein
LSFRSPGIEGIQKEENAQWRGDLTPGIAFRKLGYSFQGSDRRSVMEYWKEPRSCSSLRTVATVADPTIGIVAIIVKYCKVPKVLPIRWQIAPRRAPAC